MAYQLTDKLGRIRIVSKRKHMWICEAKGHFCGHILHRLSVTIYKHAWCHSCDGVEKLRSVLE